MLDMNRWTIEAHPAIVSSCLVAWLLLPGQPFLVLLCFFYELTYIGVLGARMSRFAGIHGSLQEKFFGMSIVVCAAAALVIAAISYREALMATVGLPAGLVLVAASAFSIGYAAAVLVMAEKACGCTRMEDKLHTFILLGCLPFGVWLLRNRIRQVLDAGSGGHTM